MFIIYYYLIKMDFNVQYFFRTSSEDKWARILYSGEAAYADVQEPIQFVFRLHVPTVLRGGRTRVLPVVRRAGALNIPFHATHIVMYEAISRRLNPGRQYNAAVHMTAGAVAGQFQLPAITFMPYECVLSITAVRTSERTV